MRLLAAAILLAAAPAAWADTIHLENGGTLEGVVLKETPTSVVVRLKYATVTLDRSEIASIEKKAADESAPSGPVRLARWDRAIEAVAARPWAGDLRQVPATVIDVGILKHVPYISHKSGNYEFNIYGDPDKPAGIEIGVYKDLLKDEAAKKECVEVVAALLGDPKDAEALRSLGIVPGKKEREGLTFEITPETAEDSYGGWWVSVYDVKELDAARASEEELKQITEDEEEIKKAEEEEKKAAPKTEAKKPPPAPATARPQEVVYIWGTRDLRNARPVTRAQQKHGGRRVYIRGVHRKGGVYVRPRTGGRGVRR